MSGHEGEKREVAEYLNQENISKELDLLHHALMDAKFIPGWNRKGNPPMWSQPTTPFVPKRWSYAEARSALSRAGDLVSPEFAERRNLILVNPLEGNRYPTSRTQVLAYQMIRPGEHARTHRHTPHAGRLVLEADEGAYTIVNGVKIPMLSGDVLLTPGWMWHGHGHDGNEEAYWIDFLDVPLVQMLDPMFFEPHPDQWMAEESKTRETPLLFPYSQTSQQLDATEPHPSGHFGRRIELGSPALPTIGLYMQRLDPVTRTTPYKSTANYQYCVVEGSGSTTIDGVTLEWSRGDVIVVPGWAEHVHESSDGATILAVTDEPLQRYCGYLRDSITAAGRALAGRP